MKAPLSDIEKIKQDIRQEKNEDELRNLLVISIYFDNLL